MATVADLKTSMRTDWGAAAAGWERWSGWYERTFAPVFDWCCRAAQLVPGGRVLDVACGAGQPALAEAAAVAPGLVTATDLAPEMLTVAARQAAARGAANIEFLETDAEDLQFPDATFDAVTCAYALMFCPDPVRAAAEARRVLKPGGRYACVVWDEPLKSPMLTVAGQAVARLFPATPPSPNAPGAFRFADPRTLESVLRDAGLGDVGVEPCTVVAELGSPAEYWQMFIDLAAGIKAKLATVSSSDCDRLADIVEETAAPYASSGVVRLPAGSLCAFGRK